MKSAVALSYVQIREVNSDGLKTRRYEVLTKAIAQTLLGIIQWRGGWRCYCFEPAYPTVYEQVCLREIADFIEAATREHRAGHNRK